MHTQHLERMAATDQLNTARRRLEAVRANKLKAQEELLQATRAEEQQQEAERAAVEECHRRLKGIQRREQEYDALHRRWLAMTHKQNNMVETERSVEGDATQEMGAGQLRARVCVSLNLGHQRVACQGPCICDACFRFHEGTAKFESADAWS